MVEGVAVVLMNPVDAAAHPDGVFAGHPIVADPDTPPGYARFKVKLPPEATEPEPGVASVAWEWEE